MFSGDAAHQLTIQRQIYPIEEDDENSCNVIDDEQEAFCAIKARQEDQAERLRSSQGRISDKINRADLCLQLVSSYMD